MCPYDTEALDAAVIEEAHHSHPHLVEGGAYRESDCYAGLAAVVAPFDAPLPEPEGQPAHLRFEEGPLNALRQFVERQALAAGLASRRVDELVLAVHEVAVNSLCHGAGAGILRVWEDGGAVVCEVSDVGRFDAPLAGRERPVLDREGGRGLWLVNQVCDLVQIRSLASGTVVRLHMRRD
jgi:anti-sigma regulatory factor (Ser/Thr protein kinase)